MAGPQNETRILRLHRGCTGSDPLTTVLRPFLTWPHPKLRTAVAPIAEINDDVRRVWADMVATMDAMPGYGLAAPQIGVGLSLAVVDCSDSRGQAILMANPSVLHASIHLHEHDEASPNLPGVSARISRPRAVTVRFLNANGQWEERDLVHLWATSAQHQIDHLAGRMYFDNLSPLRRKMLLAKATKYRVRA